MHMCVSVGSALLRSDGLFGDEEGEEVRRGGAPPGRERNAGVSPDRSSLLQLCPHAVGAPVVGDGGCLERNTASVGHRLKSEGAGWREGRRLAYRADASSSVKHQVAGLFQGHGQLPHFTLHFISVIKHLRRKDEYIFIHRRPRTSDLEEQGSSLAPECKR